MKSKTNLMLHFGNSNADMKPEPLPLPVSLVVHGDDVHGDVVLLVRVEARNLHSHGGKHPPGGAGEKHVVKNHPFLFPSCYSGPQIQNR